jgi:thioredoxin-related protein
MKSNFVAARTSIAICFVSLFLMRGSSQDMPGDGIKFENGLSWQDVVKKASAENKFILVDCYTTWCLPCRKMEQQVYPLKDVGKYFNEHFLSVKLQIDSTSNDNESVKARYEDAAKIKSKYAVNAFPTYLYFTPDGRLLNQSRGVQEPTTFIKNASYAIDPQNNYYEFIEDYKKGVNDYSRYPAMASEALRLKDTAVGYKLAKEYIATLKGDELFTEKNIYFLAEFTRTARDPGFNLFLSNSKKINIAMNDPDYSQQIIQAVIYRSHVANVLTRAVAQGKQPDFVSMQSSLAKEFGKYYAERVIASTKPSWYRSQKNYQQYTRYLIAYLNTYTFPGFPMFKSSTGSGEDLLLNNYAWEIFKYSEKKEELAKALVWSGKAVMMNPVANWMDTYANLLYKMGKTDLAIQWETVASGADPTDASIRQNLDAMKQGKPTWPQKK